MLSRRFFLAAATAALSLSPALAHSDHPEGFHVHDAYARIGATGSGAVFLTLHNNTAQDERLTGARTDIAERAELHTHTMTADGVMQMVPIEGGVAMPYGEMHEFVRGGDHIMLMGLTRELKDSDTFSLTLVFDSGAEFTFDVVVDNARMPGDSGDMPMEGHGTGHGTGG